MKTFVVNCITVSTVIFLPPLHKLIILDLVLQWSSTWGTSLVFYSKKA